MKQEDFRNAFQQERSPLGDLLAGKDLYVINCLFVIWNYQKRGVAKNMMCTAIDIARTSSRKGIVAFGYTDPKLYLPVLFFEKFGFRDL